MHSLKDKPASFNAHGHIAIDQPLQQFVSATNSFAQAAQLNLFYQEMLELYSPQQQEQLDQNFMHKEIEALFRLDRVLIAVLYSDHSLACYTPAAATAIESLSTAPISRQRMLHLFKQQYGDSVTMEYFSAEQPTQADLISGALLNSHDLEAGFCIDSRSHADKVGDWTQIHQHWLRDYLYFNLAQISADKSLPPAMHAPAAEHRTVEPHPQQQPLRKAR